MSKVRPNAMQEAEHFQWLEARLQADGEAAEAVSDFFARVGTGGAVLEELAVKDGTDDTQRTYWVKTYVPVGTEEEEREQRRRIEEGLWHLAQIRPLGAVEFRLLSFQDWAEAWKKDYRPLQLGRRLVIKPSWCEWPEVDGQLVVEIDPGQAFGTGLHPSTQLCLMELEKWASPGQTVLDLGTGSGILAITAAMLGAERVLALDLDPVAIRVAEENAQANGVRDRIDIAVGTLPQRDSAHQSAVVLSQSVAPTGFDVILVNILAEVIAQMVDDGLTDWLAPNGLMIAAGIIDLRAELVLAALQARGLKIIERQQQGDWVVLVARKPALSGAMTD